MPDQLPASFTLDQPPPVTPPQPTAGTWEDRGIGGMVWHPAPSSGAGSDRTRADNSLLGLPPEAVLATSLPVVRAMASAGAGLAAKAAVAGGVAGDLGVAQAKYWAAKFALTKMGIPAPLAEVAAVLASGYRGGKAAERGPATIPPNSTGTGSLVRVSDEPLAFKVNAPPPAVTTPPSTPTGSVARLSDEPLAFKVTAPPAEPVVRTPPSTGTGSVARLSNEPLAFKVNAPEPPVIPRPTGTNAPTSGPPPEVPPPQAMRATAPPAPGAPLATGTGFQVRVSNQPIAFTVNAPAPNGAAPALGQVPAAAAAVPKLVLTEAQKATVQRLVSEQGMDLGEATRTVWNQAVRDIVREGKNKGAAVAELERLKAQAEAAAAVAPPTPAAAAPPPAAAAAPPPTAAAPPPAATPAPAPLPLFDAPAAAPAAAPTPAAPPAAPRGVRRVVTAPPPAPGAAPASPVAAGRAKAAGAAQKALAETLGLEESHQAADAAAVAARKSTQHLSTQDIQDYAAQFTGKQVAQVKTLIQDGRTVWDAARVVIANILAGKP